MSGRTREQVRGLRAFVVVTVVAGATLVAGAAPASAHGLGGLTPTNYETTLVGMTPRVPRLQLEVVDLGTKLQLTNDTAHDATVLGYDDEPYLRVGAHGVFENTRSPATYLNKSFTLQGAPPKQADATAAPEWKKISDGNTARWHDHRAHYMGTSDPPAVARDRDHRHVIDTFPVKMRWDGEPVTATGHITWVPPPSPWPFVLGALALAGIVVVASRTSAWRTVFAITLGGLILSEILHVVGLWGASTAGTGTKLVESGYSLGGILLALLALWWMRRKGAEAAVPLVLVATIFLFVAGGLADATSLGNSQIPTTFAPGFARFLITVTLGLGLGLAVAAAWRLRPPTPASKARQAPAHVTS
jgi:hypothetical protein